MLMMMIEDNYVECFCDPNFDLAFDLFRYFRVKKNWNENLLDFFNCLYFIDHDCCWGETKTLPENEKCKENFSFSL